MSVSPPVKSSSAIVNTTRFPSVPVTSSLPPSSILMPVSSVNFTTVPSVTVSVTPFGTTTQLRTKCTLPLFHVALPTSRPSSMNTSALFCTNTSALSPPLVNVCQPFASAVVTHVERDEPSGTPTFSVPCASRPPRLVRISRRTAAALATAGAHGSDARESTMFTTADAPFTFMPHAPLSRTVNVSIASGTLSLTSGISMNFVPSPVPVQLSVPDARV